MAYSHSYGTATSTADFLGKLRDFMVSLGWTLEDDFISMNTPLLALSTTGESGNQYFATYFAAELITGYGNNQNQNWGNQDATAMTYDRVYPFICSKWEKIGTSYFNPTPVAYANTFNGGTTFTLQAGTTSTFTSYSGGKTFGVNDTVFMFGGRYNRDLRYSMPYRRLQVTSVSITVLSVNAFTSGSIEAYNIINRPYGSSQGNVATTNGTENSMCITTGGPFNLAGGIGNYTVKCNAIWTLPSSFSYYFYGDKDAVVIGTKLPGKYYNFKYIGLYDTAYDSTTTTVTVPAYTGAFTVTVANPAIFQVGHKYQINCGKYWNTIIVSAIDGNVLTSSVALQNDCQNGSIIGDDPLPVCILNLNSYGYGGNYGTDGYVLYTPYGINNGYYNWSYADGRHYYISTGSGAVLLPMNISVSNNVGLFNRTRRWASDRHNIMPISIAMVYNDNYNPYEYAGTLKLHIKHLGDWNYNIMFAWSNEDQIMINGQSHKIFNSDRSAWDVNNAVMIFIKE